MRGNIKSETNLQGQGLPEKTPGRTGDLNLALKGGCDKKINAHVHICEGDLFFKILLCKRYTQDII